MIMTYEDAIELLKAAPRDDKPSRLNNVLTRRQATEIIEKAILEKSPRIFQRDGVTLDLLFEKRVHQVVNDQKRVGPNFAT